MNSNEPSFSAWRDYLGPNSPPSTPPPSSLRMELDSEMPAGASAPRLANSQTTFDALYRDWYLRFQQSPTLAGPPPVPYTQSAAHVTSPMPAVHAYSPPPRVNLPVNAPPRGIGKSLAAKPEAYDGTKEKYVQWWHTIQLYIAGFDAEPTDRQKILIVLSYMKGSNAAGRFTGLYVTQGLLAPLTFDEFMAKLDDAFRPAALQCIAEGKLFKLRQDKETVEDFIIHMKQLIIEANYHVNSHSCLLVNILRNGIRNEVVEYVECSQPELLRLHSFACWEAALIHADQVLSEIAERKRSHNTLLVPASTSFAPRAAPTKVPTSSTSATTPSASQLSTKADVHPNQPGMFGGAGVPMDINKACAEGKCAKCGGA